MAASKKTKVILVACGSFNPITNMHLRLFEIARDTLHQTGKYVVVGGIISPVNDSYPKKDLVSAKHRCAMVELACQSSDWIRLDSWEAEQSNWTATCDVLRHHKQAALQSSNHNDVDAAVVMSAKRRKTNANKKKTPAAANDVSLHSNSSLDGATEVKFLCGADVLQSFSVPNLWSREDMEEIVGQFGVVVCTRSNCNLDEYIYESDLLTKNKANVFIAREWFGNEISATKIRRALKRSESVRYLLQDSVIDYIRKHNLYGACDDK